MVASDVAWTHTADDKLTRQPSASVAHAGLRRRDDLDEPLFAA